jgi:hypothetical protein
MLEKRFLYDKLLTILQNIYKLFLQIFLCAYNLDKHQTMYKTYGRNKRTNMHSNIHIFVSVIEEPTVEVETTLRLMVSQSVRLGVKPTLGLVTRCYLSEICSLVSVGRPL